MAQTIAAARAAAAEPHARPVRRLRVSGAGAAAALAAVLLLAFAPWWAAGRVFAPLDIVTELFEPWASAGDGRVDVHNHFTTDAVTQVIPYLHLAKHAFEADGEIGWSSWTWGGRPEYANTSAPYSDWTIHLLRVTDVFTAWHLGLLAQLALAGFGMLVFLRARGLAPDAALLGSLAYAANSQFVLWIHHRWQLAAFCWIPWLAWSLDRARRGRRDAALLAPIFVALSLLGGSLQTNAFTALTLIALGGTWAFERFRADDARGAVGALLYTSALGVLGAGLASFALVPEVGAFLANVGTGHERGALGYPGGALEPLKSLGVLLAQIAPSLTGSPRSLDLNRVLGRSFYDLAYFGALPVGFAYMALVRGRAPLAARALIALGLLIPFTPLVGPLYHRVQLLFVFGGSWAFAHTWQRMSPEEAARFARRLTIVLVGGAASWAIASGTLWLAREPLVAWLQERVAAQMDAGVGTFQIHRAWMLERAGRLPNALALWNPRQLATLGAVALGVTAVGWRARRRDGAPALLFALALCIELGVFANGWVTASQPSDAYPWTRDLVAVREMLAAEPADAPPRLSVEGDRERPPILTPNLTVALGFETLQSYESVRTPGMWLAAGMPYDALALGRLGVSHALTFPDRTPSGDGWERVYSGSSLALWRNERALPRYLALPRAPAPDVDVLAEQLRRAPRATASVRVLEATPNRRLLEVPAGSVALRVAENHAAGWEARIAGESGRFGPSFPVAGGADGSWVVTLPRAEHPRRLELRYRPPLRTAGRGIAVVALCATGLLALLPWRGAGNRRRTRSADAAARGRELLR